MYRHGVYFYTMDIRRKLFILADAAKYDASCSSSGARGRDSRGGKGMGSTEGMGICHSYTPDGRCISLLKVLLTNFCIYDCLYCINRKSSNVARARFSVEEVVHLTLDFYRRNCIEGLFLSSGIIRSPDYTMEQLVRVARCLREAHDFRGYIHLKTIPDAAPELIEQAGRYADRLSINVELPTVQGLQQLAPEKKAETIRHAMGFVAGRLAARRSEAAAKTVSLGTGQRATRARPPRFSPAGQTTQMIVGADRASDADILAASSVLYGDFGLRRVYYSAFSPIPDAAQALPAIAPPLVREHRLYQADWLVRFYGFRHAEITQGLPQGMLDLELDPKLAWALANRQAFPVALDRAPREMLLRVPGLGVKSVQLLLKTRRVRSIRLEDLERLRVPLAKVLPFVELTGHHPGAMLDDAQLRQRLLALGQHSAFLKPSALQPQAPAQLALF